MNPNPMKKAEELGPISVDEFAEWLKRDLYWLDGYASGLGKEQPNPLGSKVQGIRRNLKRFLMGVNIDEREEQNR